MICLPAADYGNKNPHHPHKNPNPHPSLPDTHIYKPFAERKTHVILTLAPVLPTQFDCKLDDTDFVGGESQRDSALQPRVARYELPWVTFASVSQLRRSCALMLLCDEPISQKGATSS